MAKIQLLSVGQKINRWTIIKDLGHQVICYVKSVNKYGDLVMGPMRNRVYLCKCDCGTIKKVTIGNLKRGLSKGCRNCAKRVGCRNNETFHPLHSLYNNMLERCYNPKCKAYKYYGHRGITVSDRWKGKDGFANFLEDMGARPEGTYKKGHPKYTLDRINNDGNYEPSNCRWATAKIQSNNRRVIYTLTSSNVSKFTNYTRERIRQLSNEGFLDEYIEQKIKLKKSIRYVFKPEIVGYLNSNRKKFKRDQTTIPMEERKYRGVSIAEGKNSTKWRAFIRNKDKLIHLGSHETQECAARVYDRKAKELFGPFAKLNFP